MIHVTFTDPFTREGDSARAALLRASDGFGDLASHLDPAIDGLIHRSDPDSPAVAEAARVVTAMADLVRAILDQAAGRIAALPAAP